MGAEGISYEMNVPFPAAAPITDAAARLARLGFAALKESSSNPGIPTSMVRSWTSYIDATKSPRVRRWIWSSEWRNARGDAASYAVSYVAPEGGVEPLRRAEVSGGVIPAALQSRIDEEMSKFRQRVGTSRGDSTSAPFPADAGRTVIDARIGDCFVASAPAGEAIFQVTNASGGAVGYRWRFRAAGGAESSGASPVASSLQAGPLRLGWMPSPVPGDERAVGGVGYFADEMDLLPLPAAHFETLDLETVRTLATLLPDRNERYGRFRLSPAVASTERLSALTQSGGRVALGPDRALLVSGPKGRGVIEIAEVDTNSVRYRWRFRDAGSKADASGTAEASQKPLPSLSLGPYALLWEMRSLSKVRDAQGTRMTNWQADVRYLPEELSAEGIPASAAPSIDLGMPASPR